MWCFARKACTRAVEWAGALSWWSWSARSVIVECDGHTVHKLSQRRLTAEWLVPQDSDCSWMHSKVFSDWLPSYIKATRSVLEIFKMAGCFPDSLRILVSEMYIGGIQYLIWISADSCHFTTRSMKGLSCVQKPVTKTEKCHSITTCYSCEFWEQRLASF